MFLFLRFFIYFVTFNLNIKYSLRHIVLVDIWHLSAKKPDDFVHVLDCAVDVDGWDLGKVSPGLRFGSDVGNVNPGLR